MGCMGENVDSVIGRNCFFSDVSNIEFVISCNCHIFNCHAAFFVFRGGGGRV